MFSAFRTVLVSRPLLFSVCVGMVILAEDHMMNREENYIAHNAITLI